MRDSYQLPQVREKKNQVYTTKWFPVVVYTPFNLKVSTAQGDPIPFPVKVHHQLDQKCSPVIPKQFRKVPRCASIETLLFDMRDGLCKLEAKQTQPQTWEEF